MRHLFDILYQKDKTYGICLCNKVSKPQAIYTYTTLPNLVGFVKNVQVTDSQVKYILHFILMNTKHLEHDRRHYNLESQT
jgi:hypothetical protein